MNQTSKDKSKSVGFWDFDLAFKEMVVPKGVIAVEVFQFVFSNWSCLWKAINIYIKEIPLVIQIQATKRWTAVLIMTVKHHQPVLPAVKKISRNQSQSQVWKLYKFVLFEIFNTWWPCSYLQSVNFASVRFHHSDPSLTLWKETILCRTTQQHRRRRFHHKSHPNQCDENNSCSGRQSRWKGEERFEVKESQGCQELYRHW